MPTGWRAAADLGCLVLGQKRLMGLKRGWGDVGKRRWPAMCWLLWGRLSLILVHGKSSSCLPQSVGKSVAQTFWFLLQWAQPLGRPTRGQ